MILPIVDLVLVIVCAGLWHYVLSMPPVAPPMPPFPVRSPMRRELDAAAFDLFYASAVSSVAIRRESQ